MHELSHNLMFNKMLHNRIYVVYVAHVVAVMYTSVRLPHAPM